MVKQINQIPYDDALFSRLIAFAQQFETACILNSHQYEDVYGKYELLAAFGVHEQIRPEKGHFEVFKKRLKVNNSWWFGHFSYDLKNQVEKLDSKNSGSYQFGDLFFFQPKILFVLKRGHSKVDVLAQDGSDQLFSVFETTQPLNGQLSLPDFQSRLSRQEYIDKLEDLKAEIQYGNVYEANFCQEFFACSSEFNPYKSYLALLKKSPVPFAAFYKTNKNYALSLSPERFLRKRENQLISQPIKGTAKRGQSLDEDEMIKNDLKKSLKDRTENVMIVDLVRNDLSRTAKTSTVKVEELFGLYSFPTVHQLISTVSSDLDEHHHWIDAIKLAFPMGSMTGAPKIKAMEIIDDLEVSRRELYSGSIGYINPQSNFDFSVVIRTLFYNKKENYLSMQVGGAITQLSDPEKEYEECLLKAKAIFDFQDAERKV